MEKTQSRIKKLSQKEQEGKLGQNLPAFSTAPIKQAWNRARKLKHNDQKKVSIIEVNGA